MSLQQHEYYLRGAVALNNTGVALMEQQAYRDARRCLKDAVVVLRNTYEPHFIPPIAQQANKDTCKRLAIAAQRLSQPQKSLRSPFPFQVISDTENLSRIADSPQLGAMDHLVFCPIRIDTTDDLLRDEGILRATISYNLGLALAYLATTTRSQCKANQLQRTAKTILRYADTVFSQCLEQTRDPTRCLLLGMLVLQVLLFTVMRPSQARTATRKLGYLRYLALQHLPNTRFGRGYNVSGEMVAAAA